MNDLILQPILFMGLLSLVMMLLMYITRIPAAKVLEAEGVDLQKLSHPAQLGGVFPSRVERVADNYNHLWEQPTLFYAVVLVIWALGHTDPIHLYAAWAYCALRFFALDCAGDYQSRVGALQPFFYELDCARCYANQRNHHCCGSGLKRLNRESNV